MKPFTTLAAGVFAVVSLLHAVWFAAGWEVTVASVSVPVWLSAPA